ncbi:hypothetical protein RFI_11302 [Reticulomyxa filosa]|uniref:Uncharacterized protein n=1 Tax=Reticulomyxa filosa TaxID=46433 RepID=X6NIV6_RETFI|nr:hypothetical protein RFI_11302 [Reticulomyxa filosa]|eukprot:ETO25833.1 hypothetical protein RFI_11302 [Reticulomyxa filosa]
MNDCKDDFSDEVPSSVTVVQLTVPINEKTEEGKFLKHEKVTKLMSFLDTVANEADGDLQFASSSSLHPASSEPFCTDLLLDATTSKSSSVSAASNVFVDIKSKMIALKSQLNDKNKTIQLLQQNLEHSKNKQKDIEKALEASYEQKLQNQKKEFEHSIHRNLSFVDRLLKDKEKLSLQCDGA